MTVEVKPQFILITDIVPGEGYVKRKYIGYSKAESIERFNYEFYPEDVPRPTGNPHLPYDREVDFQR